MSQMTVKQAAEKWGVSASLVYKWLSQHRLRTVRPGHEILITQAQPPKRGARLTAEQRAAWPKRPAAPRNRGSSGPRRSVSRYTGGPLTVSTRKKIAP
jgi:excisionase family DNA binding protein